MNSRSPLSSTVVTTLRVSFSFVFSGRRRNSDFTLRSLGVLCFRQNSRRLVRINSRVFGLIGATGIGMGSKRLARLLRVRTSTSDWWSMDSPSENFNTEWLHCIQGISGIEFIYSHVYWRTVALNGSRGLSAPTLMVRM